MLDVRLDQRPVLFPPPPPLLSSSKEHHVVQTGGYLDAASVLNRLMMLPAAFAIPSSQQQQQQQQHHPGSRDVINPPLAPVMPLSVVDRLSEFPRIPDSLDLAAAMAGRVPEVTRSRLGLETDPISRTAFHRPYLDDRSMSKSSRLHRIRRRHHHPANTLSPTRQQHFFIDSSVPSSSSLSSSSPSSASSSSSLSMPSLTLSIPHSSSSSLSSPPGSGDSGRFIGQRNHSSHDDRYPPRDSRKSSTSPGAPCLPWRPLPAKADGLPVLYAPTLQEGTFRRGAVDYQGRSEMLCHDHPSDRTLYRALSSLPWPLVGGSLQMDGSLASSLMRFAPISSAAGGCGLVDSGPLTSSSSWSSTSSVSGIGRVPFESFPFPSPAFMYQHFAHPDLTTTAAGMKDAFCRASSPRLDLRSSPGKELPSKVKKQNRVKDRHELTSILDSDHAASERLANIKKTTSTQTQTQFSSYPAEGLPPPPYHTTHDTIKLDRLATSIAPLHSPSYAHHLSHPHPHQHHSILPPPPPPPPPAFIHSSFNQGGSSLPPLPPPPPHPSLHSTSSSSPNPASSSSPSSSVSSTSSPTTHKSSIIPKAPPLYGNRSPPPQYAAVARTPVDVQHAPLNLSISSQAPPPSSPTTPTHPSVISCGSVAPSMDSMAPDQGGVTDMEVMHGGKKGWSNHARGDDQGLVNQDEAIEEHFRRSLGQKYTEASSPKKKGPGLQMTVSLTSTTSTTSSSSSSPTTAMPSPEAEGVSITGSVDDHFARALGNQMWTAIKAKSEPSTPEVFPDTVDAHFAKALGASMWKKIQAEVEEVVDPTTTELPTPSHNHLHHPQQQQQQQPLQPQRRPSSSSPIHSRQVATT